MSLSLRPYGAGDAEAWDAFCALAYQATFLHTRRFLSYHGDRFHDCSLIIEDGARWLGILPAAQYPAETHCVISHPGISYGGILHQGRLRGERMIEAIKLVGRHYAERGYRKLIYKAVPWIYHRTPAQDDIYALFRLGAKLTRSDLSCTIDLQQRLATSERRRRGLKKARQAGIEVRYGNEYLPAFWTVLTENLKRKHNVNPVHTLAEATLLADRFPENIRCTVGLLAGEVVAGVLVFSTHVADHAQYIAASEVGYQSAALDMVLEQCITDATHAHKRWFDFGISTEDEGRILNEGLYRFKSEFGGGGAIFEFFTMEL